MAQSDAKYLRLLKQRFGHTGHNAEGVIQFLMSIRHAKWFSRCGKPHPRDFSLIRVKFRTVAYDSIVSLCKVKGPAWELVMDKADSLKCPDKMHGIFMSAMEVFSKDRGMWRDPLPTVFERVSFGNLSKDIGHLSAALWIMEPHAIRLWTELLGYYVEGHFPCGWAREGKVYRLMVF